ncbi:molybdopterin-dependent oxidoreductase alpha subunit [Variovorax boronicumulans]|nr:molybdopterin-dependent oxidoreductase alpha subunit [Variovorax boronicumulans]MDQ0006536.1 molybdopterin-dependent oxidoreductase alpha subunit [Variovorax boronicumulans]MDQ0038629.1 molybdopterin-dependent oxidoreductase alpha subunit [Variovorax boronicumulans]
MSDNIEGVRPYEHPAGGWDALGAVARAIRAQMTPLSGTRIMLENNQPDGFDCPGCAWPDPKHTSTFEFCENGAKAVTWEATRKRATPEVFLRHTVTELLGWSDHDIENLGRLTHPMVYDATTDHYVQIAWDEANTRIADALNALPSPHMAEFYTSGRTSNEAAFLYQLFVRAFGTNNFPDCSNMCHEATSVGLPKSIGIGKGTVTLEDFDHADLIISMGHNPGTNHPRMMTTLHAASRRGVPIVVFNPLRERALERFAAPQNPVEMVTLGSTDIASEYLQVRVGGDAAALKGVMKGVLAIDAESLAVGGIGVLDRAFIASHTQGFEALVKDLEETAWADIERVSGLEREALERVAQLYSRAKGVIVAFGMGITQHTLGTENVQQISNLLMLRGNYGRPGAGICPVRGHSNVQGNRTVGIDEKAPHALREGIERVFGFVPPAAKGHDAAEAIEAIRAGHSTALMCLGGNLAVAIGDPVQTHAALRRLDLAVHVATKPNRSHLLVGRQTFLLPCLGRTELDLQAGGVQCVTVEDSMSMVHASTGRLPPPSATVRSEPAIVAGIAKAVLGDRYRIDWEAMAAQYDHIRDLMEQVLTGFGEYNLRIRRPGGFRLPIGPADRIWHTPSGRAEFLVIPGTCDDPRRESAQALTLTTIRSHDQYNTTIYGFDDRYRGIFGRRDVVFVNADDLAARGLQSGDLVDLEAIPPRGDMSDNTAAVMRRLTAVAYDLPKGSSATYYPEANVLVSLSDRDPQSGTPSYKSIPVRIRLST